MSFATLGNLFPAHVRGEAYVAHDCSKCALSRGRTQVVPGEGAQKPLAVFVGEAPGPDEDREGRPFIGRAGKILRESLRQAGWRDDEVWITNAVKCFPHELREDGKKTIRAPDAVETSACRPHLQAELKALKPGLIVALGRSAALSLTGDASIQLDRDHGRVLDSPAGRLFLTFHPSGLHYKTGRREQFLEDLRVAREAAKKAEASA